MPKLRSLFFASTALTACAALSAGYAQYRADELARAAFADAAGALGAHAAFVGADAWSGRARVEGLVVAQGDVRIEVGSLSLPGRASAFGLIGSAQALEASAVAENIVVTTPLLTYRIPKITAANSSLTGPELAALFDAKNASPIAERVAKLNATAILIPEAVMQFDTAEQKQTVIYRDIKLTNVVGGKVAEVIAAGATMAVINPQVGELSGAYGAMSVRNLDLALIARVLTEKRKSPTEARAPVYDSFAIDNYVLKGGNAQFELKVGKISGRDVKMRPLANGVSGLMETLQKAQQAKGDGGKPSKDEQKAILGLVRDMFDAFEFASAEVQGVSFRGKDNEGTPVALDIGRLFMGGIGGGARIGEIGYEGMKVNAAQAKFGIGAFAIRGFDYQKALATGLRMIETGQETPPRAVDVLPTLDQFLLGNIDVDVPAPKNDGNAENGARIRMSLGKLEYNGGAFVNSIPTRASLRADKLVFDLPTAKGGTPELRELAALGLKRVDLSTGLSIAWESAKQQLALAYDSSGPGLGAVKLGIVAENVGKELFSGDMAMAQATALGASISKLDLGIDDSGMVGLLLAMQAKSTGKSVDQLRTEFVQAAALGIPAMLGNAPAAKTLGTAVSKFLAAPKNLKVTITSKDGVGAADVAGMQSPLDLLSKIDVKANANQ